MLLTTKEATARLGISRAALYAAMADGRLKYVEKYGKRLIDERALKSYTPRAYRGQRLREKQKSAGSMIGTT
jgi:excisionase family DNA binding protein